MTEDSLPLDPLAAPERLAVLAQTELLDSLPEEAFDRLTRLAAKILRAPVALVSLVDPTRQFFKSSIGLPEPWATARQTPLSHSFCQHVVTSREPLIIADARTNLLVCDNLAVPDLNVAAYAGIPLLLSDGSILGSFCVIDTVPREWTADELDTLTGLTASVVTEIELRLSAQQARREAAEAERARAQLATAFEREHQIAETLQKTIVMTGYEVSFPRLTVEPFYQAAWSEALVGGDFFDAFPLSDTQVALAVGDASGKGLDAAVRIAQVKYALRAFLREYPYVSRTLSRLNDFMCDTQRLDDQADDTFVALALAVLDTVTGDLRVGLAGAEPPLLLHADGTTAVLSQSGFPLGVVAGQEYATLTVTLTPGDTLLLTTDGLTEARRGRDFLGHEGLMEMATQCARDAASLQETGQRLLDTARAFAGGTLHDDACLLLARWH